MAIIKRNNHYQVKFRGSDGKWVTDTFAAKRDAEAYEIEIKQQRRDGVRVTSQGNQLTVTQYFERWFETVRHQASPGWRACQKQFFHVYIEPVIGHLKLKAVTPDLIANVVSGVKGQRKSEQTQLHVFNLLRKIFRDAVELFQLTTFNPVLRTLRPKVPLKETKHLNLEQVKSLLQYSSAREYGTAIWLQVFLGLRVSEIIALSWEDLDLETGIVTIRRSYSRKDTWVQKERVFKEYPKGRKHHSRQIPGELLVLLKQVKRTSPFVAATSFGEMLSYEFYLETLKNYCQELGIPKVGTHGLRHSTSELYLHHGATRDDLRRLFAHSSLDITDRYVHERGTNLEKVTKVIRLFPKETVACSQNVPTSEKTEVGEI
jgi:integrase